MLRITEKEAIEAREMMRLAQESREKTAIRSSIMEKAKAPPLSIRQGTVALWEPFFIAGSGPTVCCVAELVADIVLCWLYVFCSA